MLFARLLYVGETRGRSFCSLSLSFSEVGGVDLKDYPAQRRVCPLCLSSCGIQCHRLITPPCIFLFGAEHLSLWTVIASASIML